MTKLDARDKAKSLNPTFAENMRILMKGRSMGALREQMALAGYPIGQGTINRAANGDPGIRLESMRKLASYFDVSPEQLLQEDLGSTSADGFVEVRRYNVKVAAGSGAVTDMHEELGSLQFRSEFLRECGVPARAASIVDVKGDSMEPTIPHGSMLLINRNEIEPVHGKIFVLAKRIDGMVVKRLVEKEEGWFARSDNSERYKDFQIDDGEPVTVLGRVVWMGARIR